MFYLRVSIGIFLALSISRFVPHPPNFTSLIALGFYVPAIFGIRYLPALILSFIITDFIIGFHETALFTWGSVVLIGLISKNFIKNILSRISGALLGTYLSVILWLLGFKYTLAGKAAIYNQLSTILIIILARVFLKESMNLRKWFAVILSVCGALLVSFG